MQIRASYYDKTREAADRAFQDLYQANVVSEVVFSVLQRVFTAVRALFRFDVDSVTACGGNSIR